MAEQSEKKPSQKLSCKHCSTKCDDIDALMKHKINECEMAPCCPTCHTNMGELDLYRETWRNVGIIHMKKYLRDVNELLEYYEITGDPEDIVFATDLKVSKHVGRYLADLGATRSNHLKVGKKKVGERRKEKRGYTGVRLRE